MLIENLTFRLAAGTDEAAFLAADALVQTDYFSPRPGFVRRTTARGADGEWLVSTFWWDASHADESAQAVAGHEAHEELSRLIDQSSVQSKRYETLE